MKNLGKIGFLCSALIFSGVFISQTNAEILGMRPDNYPSSEALKFSNIICEVKNVYEFQDDSSLKKLSNGDSFFDKALELIGLSSRSVYGKFIGQKFLINRETGNYKFKDFGNEYYKNTIIDIGSKKQSYKVLSKSSGGYVHTQYIQVDVYQKNGEMNFRIIESEVLFTGLCQIG